MAVAIEENRALVEHINKYRLAHGEGAQPLSMAKTAAALGVSRVTLSGWLNGYGNPTLENAVRIADLLGITLDELAGRGDA